MTAEPRFHGEWPDPQSLPEPMRRLHKKIMADAREDRESRLTREDKDETGRRWPGLNQRRRPPKR